MILFLILKNYIFNDLNNKFLENRDRSFLIVFYPTGRNSGLEFRVLDQNQIIYYDIFGELNAT